MILKDVDATSVIDVLPNNLLIPVEQMHWGPVEATKLHARSRICQPILTGAVLALWFKYGQTKNATYVMPYDRDEAGNDDEARLISQATWLRERVINTTGKGDEDGDHVGRVIGRVLLHPDRNRKWSLPLSLAQEERIVGRNLRTSGPLGRADVFMTMAHTISMDLPEYMEKARRDRAKSN